MNLVTSIKFVFHKLEKTLLKTRLIICAGFAKSRSEKAKCFEILPLDRLVLVMEKEFREPDDILLTVPSLLASLRTTPTLHAGVCHSFTRFGRCCGRG